MNNFLQYVNPRLSKFTKFDFLRSYEYKVRERVVNYFQLKDINQLRDKFEGVAFLDKIYKRAIAIWISSKILNTTLIDLDNFEPQNITLSFLFDNKKWEIVIFDYGEIPKIDINLGTNYLIILKRNNSCFYFCGLLKEELCLKLISQNELKDNGHFIHFELLAQSV